MNKEERDHLAAEVTNLGLTKEFETQMGQKVLVDRTEVEGEYVDQLREVLRDMAKDLQATGSVPKGIPYKGSFSIHCYYSEVLKSMVFATVSAPDLVSFPEAESACRELWGTVCETYGHKRQTRRSGAS